MSRYSAFAVKFDLLFALKKFARVREESLNDSPIFESRATCTPGERVNFFPESSNFPEVKDSCEIIFHALAAVIPSDSISMGDRVLVVPETLATLSASLTEVKTPFQKITPIHKSARYFFITERVICM